MKLAPRGYLTISHAIHKLAPMSPVSTFYWRIKSHRKWQTHMHVSSPKFPRFPPNRFSLFPGALALACGQLLVSKQAWNCTKAVTNSKPTEKGAYTKKKGRKTAQAKGQKAIRRAAYESAPLFLYCRPTHSRFSALFLIYCRLAAAKYACRIEYSSLNWRAN